MFPVLYLGSGSAVDDLPIRSGIVSKDRVISCLSGPRSYSGAAAAATQSASDFNRFTDLNRRRRVVSRVTQTRATIVGRRRKAENTASNETMKILLLMPLPHFLLPPLDDHIISR